MATPAKRVLITGAAGQIAYSLIFQVAAGEIFGPNQPIILHLLDIPMCAEGLKGVVLELQDCALSTLQSIVATTNVEEAFTGVDVAILVGAFPRREGMERKDLLFKNAAIFKEQGAALNKWASRDVKVLVVGNPANTNALIAMTCAPDLPKKNFSALTRLDHNRAKYQVAAKAATTIDHVHNVVIWGNHSSTQYPDVSHGFIVQSDGSRVPVRQAINDDAWLNGDFIKTVQQRGAAIIAARKFSSAASAAKAIIDHLRNWFHGTPEGEFVSMAVHSDGSYGVPEGLIYSFPVTCKDGDYTIVQGLSVDSFSQSKLDATTAELQQEKATAFEFLAQ